MPLFQFDRNITITCIFPNTIFSKIFLSGVAAPAQNALLPDFAYIDG